MYGALNHFLEALEWKDRLYIYRARQGAKFLREANKKGVKGVKLLLEVWSKRANKAKLLGAARQKGQASWRS